MQRIDKSSIKSHCWREWRCCCSTHCRWILHSKVGSYEAKAYESVTSTWLVTIGLSVRDAGGSSSTCMHVRCYAPHQLQSYNFCTCSVHLRDVKITLRLLSLNFTRQFRRPIPSVIWLPWSKWIQCLPSAHFWKAQLTGSHHWKTNISKTLWELMRPAISLTLFTSSP